jgi:putative tryptophan/tyrosine transport system substrate-binding protein
MNRREFIAGLGGAAVWPVAARAQQGERVRRIGALWPQDENDPVGKLFVAAFLEGLAELGWSQGRNLRVEARWNRRTADERRQYVAELINARPDVLVTGTGRLTREMQQQTNTIPIIFVGAGDPLTLGIVASLARPEGNTTGVTDIFPSIAAKWLELLKEAVPVVSRVALIFDAATHTSGPTGSVALWEGIVKEAAARDGTRVIPMLVRNGGDVEREITGFAGEAGGAVIVVPPSTIIDRQTLNGSAMRHRLPVIYQERNFAAEGGLLSYGADMIEMLRRGGPPYVDRILRGAKPGDLPVQFPTKFILTVNLKTAKAMGLTIPESFLARADEVIE